MTTTMVQNPQKHRHFWSPVSKAGFNLKQCGVCFIYRGDVYIPERMRLTDQNRKTLEARLMELKTKFTNGSLGIETTQIKLHSFFQICEEYLKEKLTNRPNNKGATLRSQIACFKKAFSNDRLGAFNTREHSAYNAVDKWMVAYRKTACAASVNRKFNTLRAIFNWAIRKGYMRENPCKRVSKLAEPQTYPRYLEKKEIASLLAESPRREFTSYCTIVLHTGMRPEEVLELDIVNIDLVNQVIYILIQKNGDKDTVEIDDELLKLFINLIGNRTEGKLLNYTKAQLRKDSLKAIKAAKINSVKKPGTGLFTIYGLRHTFASHLLMNGEKIETVATWLRHKDLNITYKHYGYLTKRYLREAGNKINLAPVGVELKVFTQH